MKIILATCLVVFAISSSMARSVPPQTKTEYEQWTKECQSEIGIAGNIVFKDLRKESPEIKKEVFCVFKKAGVVDDQGHLVEDVFKSEIKKSGFTKDADDLMKECYVIKDSPEETTFHLFNCVEETDPAE